MKKIFTVEWVDEKGEDQAEDVEFEAEPYWDNDSFDYAGTHCTGGVGGTHHLPSYAAMDSDATWDETKFTPEMNERIKAWMEKNYDKVEADFCEQLENDSQQDYP